MDKATFADRIQELRKAKGMTQSELAEKLNVTNKAVSRWESGAGYPEITLLVPLAEALDVTVDELLGKTNEKGKKSFDESAFAFCMLFLAIILFLIVKSTLLYFLAVVGICIYYVKMQQDGKKLIFGWRAVTIVSFLPLTNFLIQLFLLIVFTFRGSTINFLSELFTGLYSGAIFETQVKLLIALSILTSMLVLFIGYHLGVRYIEKRTNIKETPILKWNQSTISKNMLIYARITNGLLSLMVCAPFVLKDVCNQYLMDHLEVAYGSVVPFFYGLLLLLALLVFGFSYKLNQNVYGKQLMLRNMCSAVFGTMFTILASGHTIMEMNAIIYREHLIFTYNNILLWIGLIGMIVIYTVWTFNLYRQSHRVK